VLSRSDSGFDLGSELLFQQDDEKRSRGRKSGAVAVSARFPAASPRFETDDRQRSGDRFAQTPGNPHPSP